MTDPSLCIVAFAIVAPPAVLALNLYFDWLRSRWSAELWVTRFRARQGVV